MTDKNKRILVTGGAGFIGSNFVHFWVKKHPNDKVVVLDKLTYAGNLENLQAVKDNIEFIQGDICDQAVVEKAFEGVSTVVHFAAETHVDRSVLGPMQFVQTNVVGTLVLLEAVKKFGIKRFHHVSTDEVYGSIDLDSKEKWTEESPYNPRSPYSASKAGSDHLVRAYFNTYNLPVTLSNCANNVGPYMYPEKFFPLAITNLLEGKNVPVYGQGKQVREWLYVEDHCSAIEKILERGKLGETYFVGPNDKEISNLEVIKLMLQVMGLPEQRIEFVKDRPGHDAKYALNTNKIKKELGWSPENNLEQTLEKTIEWYKQNQNWWKKIKESAEYKAYYQKQYTHA
jgi:dTDP-glucose 4,6-dehydratase